MGDVFLPRRHGEGTESTERNEAVILQRVKERKEKPGEQPGYTDVNFSF
jgi:hypothetical protein